MSGQWQWQTDELKFVPFHDLVNSQLEKAFLKHDPTKPLTITLKDKKKYIINFTTFTQQNAHTGTERLIRRRGPDGVMETRQAMWEWEAEPPGTFHRYDVECNDAIDRAYQTQELTCKIKIHVDAHNISNVTIHFGHLRQENAETKATRRVRRVTTTSSELVEARKKNNKKDIKKGAPTVVAPTTTTTTTIPVGSKRCRSPTTTEAATTTTTQKVVTPAMNSIPLVGVTSQRSLSDWETKGTCLLLNSLNGDDVAAPHHQWKIAGFDMDDT